MTIATTNSTICRYLQNTIFFNNIDDLLADVNNYDIYIIEPSPKVSKLNHQGKIVYYGNVTNQIFAATPYAILDDPISHKQLYKIISSLSSIIENNYLFIIQKNACQRLYIPNINYVNIEGRSLVYHLIDKNETTSTIQTSFKKATHLINHPSFIFLAPALLINLYNIKVLNDDNIIFYNNDKCYIPKTKYKLIYETLQDISY